MAEAYEPEFPTGTGAGRAPEPARTPVELIKDIIGNVQEIIRSEIRLAQAEMTEKARLAGRAGVMLAVGAVIGLYAVAFLLVSIYNALNYAVAPWLSALILFAVLGAVGGGTVAAGRQRFKRLNPTPEKTVESVKEDVEWLKDQTK